MRKLPSDTHRKEHICNAIQGTNLLYKQLGLDDGFYVGVIFDDEPTDSEVDSLLEEAQITLDE
jgi:hypothetical protein